MGTSSSFLAANPSRNLSAVRATDKVRVLGDDGLDYWVDAAGVAPIKTPYIEGVSLWDYTYQNANRVLDKTLNSSGVPITNAGYCYSAGIAVVAGDVITLNPTTGGAHLSVVGCFFNDSTFVSNIVLVNGNSVTVPASANNVVINSLGIQYPRVFLYTRGGVVQKHVTTVFTAVGDSITYGHTATRSYGLVLSEFRNFTFYNLGISGSTVATGANASASMCTRLGSIRSDTDSLVFWGGTEDYLRLIPIGVEADTSTDTFYGAMKSVASRLASGFPYAKKLIVTPMNTAFPPDGGSNPTPLSAYAAAVKYAANLYGIPIADFYTTPPINSMITPSPFFSNGLHPNNSGHASLASALSLLI